MHTGTDTHIRLKDVGQSFEVEHTSVSLFKGLNISLEQGKSYAITGPSGAGKSSLLLIMAGLENATSGQVKCTHNQQEHGMDSLRDEIGFIFQQFHLLPELTALHNVALPLKLRGRKDADEKAKTWLERVGLGHRLNHKPNMLSGGEQQRVAIARALVFDPKFIFADEPTGNLDTHSAEQISDILFSCCSENGSGLIIVTHSDALAAQAQHAYALQAGELLPLALTSKGAIAC